MAKINFTCPECGDHLLVEGLLTREFWSIEEIYDDGWHEHGELLESEGCEMSGGEYYCNTCMHRVPAYTSNKLMKWLKERNMLILGEDDINEEDN